MDLTSPKAVRQRNFIRSIYYDVDQIFKGSGIPTKLVLAMAAAETEWGEKFLIKGSNNLFNIKALRGFKGKQSSKILVSENTNDGKPYMESSSFRIYDSYTESIEDLLKLLKTNRYGFVRSEDSIGCKAEALFVAGYAKNNQYPILLTDIIRQARLKDALKGLPSRDELEEKFLQKFCGELEFETTLPGYRGIPIERSELLSVLDSYNVCVCHNGEKLGELTKENPELSLEVPLNITYQPGMNKGENSYYPDFLEIDYRPPGGSKKKAWWSIDKKRFVDSAPAGLMNVEHHELLWIDRSPFPSHRP